MSVRLATISDYDLVLELVNKLLVELGGVPLQAVEVTSVFQNLFNVKMPDLWSSARRRMQC